MKQEVEVEPLTRTTTVGEVLKRRPEVEKQIKEVLLFGLDDLRCSLKETDYSKPEYLKSECLAHLLRHHQKLGDENMVSEVARALNARLIRTIEGHISFVSPNRKDECRDEIVTSIILPIIDLESDGGDYAQVSFGQWAKLRILDAVDRYFSIQDREDKTETLTRPEDDSDEEVETAEDEFRVGDLRPEEYNVFITRALNELSENERKVFLMVHTWGWDIESQDPTVPTISRHFGKTPRTINNWLRSAERKLAKWRDQEGY